jgi:hypothetical protein
MDMASPGFFTTASRASIDKCPNINDIETQGVSVRDRVMGRNFWDMVGTRGQALMLGLQGTQL